MKFLIIAAVAAVTVAAPQYSYGPPPNDSSEEVEVVPILRDDRVHEEDGRYNLHVETGNGIVLSQSGSPDGPDGAVVKAGSYSYTAPDGTLVDVKFVADENGFQPQSDVLPVAPAFPHPIPQFVLDQIAFAAEEDAARARAEAAVSSEEVSAPAPNYGVPQ
ncbi:cuticle protein AMP1A-like [Homarus americanus]|uniref:cuticle protein AMP1A-like n=1 Tax=Homarus americanus TaxID=6706 RepID=UPI001C47A3BF|nr:cuticle protein AMP1A-like [Homarus americanus]